MCEPVVGEWKATPRYRAILTAVENLSAVASTERAVELAAQITRFNNEVIDMEHFIEFNEFCTDAEAADILRKLHELLNARRDVKQELDLINRLLNSDVRQLSGGQYRSSPTVTKLYKPRGNGDMFRREEATDNHAIENDE